MAINKGKIAFFFILSVVLTTLFFFFLPIGYDWKQTFSLLPGNLLKPYKVPGFTNPPWVVILIPYIFLPCRLSNAINVTLNVTMIILIVDKVKGGKLGLFLSLTNPFFLYLIITSNIDWIPMLAFLVPSWLGLPLLLSKPQAFGGLVLYWLKNKNSRLPVILIGLGLVGISLLVWPNWFLYLNGGINHMVWNFAPWPLLIPLGIYFLWKAYKEGDEVLAIAATPFLVPYVAPYSLSGVFACLTGKYKRMAIFIYIVIWWYAVVELRKNGMPII